MIKWDYLKAFYVLPIRPSLTEHMARDEVNRRQLFVVYFSTTVLLSLLLKVVAQIVIQRPVSSFSSIHYAVYLFRHVLVLSFTDILFYFGIQYVLKGDKNEDYPILGFTTITLTNLPVVLGGFIVSIVTVTPLYLLLVIWKFYIVRTFVGLEIEDKRQLNVSTVFLFLYYAILYFVISWAVAYLLVTVGRVST